MNDNATNLQSVHFHNELELFSLQIILAFGNYMNSSKKGAVYGFRLQSLDLVSIQCVTPMFSQKDLSFYKSQLVPKVKKIKDLQYVCVFVLYRFILKWANFTVIHAYATFVLVIWIKENFAIKLT